MVFTHGIADDTGTLPVRLVRTVIQFYHGVKNPTLYRLQAVSYIWQRPGSDHTHGVINIGVLHRLLQINLMDFVKYIVFHKILPLSIRPDSLHISHFLL